MSMYDSSYNGKDLTEEEKRLKKWAHLPCGHLASINIESDSDDESGCPVCHPKQSTNAVKSAKSRKRSKNVKSKILPTAQVSPVRRIKSSDAHVSKKSQFLKALLSFSFLVSAFAFISFFVGTNSKYQVKDVSLNTNKSSPANIIEVPKNLNVELNPLEFKTANERLEYEKQKLIKIRNDLNDKETRLRIEAVNTLKDSQLLSAKQARFDVESKKFNDERNKLQTVVEDCQKNIPTYEEAENKLLKSKVLNLQSEKEVLSAEKISLVSKLKDMDENEKSLKITFTREVNHLQSQVNSLRNENAELSLLRIKELETRNSSILDISTEVTSALIALILIAFAVFAFIKKFNQSKASFNIDTADEFQLKSRILYLENLLASHLDVVQTQISKHGRTLENTLQNSSSLLTVNKSEGEVQNITDFPSAIIFLKNKRDQKFIELQELKKLKSSQAINPTESPFMTVKKKKE